MKHGVQAAGSSVTGPPAGQGCACVGCSGVEGLASALPAVSLFPEDGELTYVMLKRDFPGPCSGIDT